MIRVENLHYSYQSKKKTQPEALRGLSFRAQEKKITGILGPNGSGKSTSFKILTTQIDPSQGDAWINDASILKNRDQVRAQIGVTFQSPSLDPHLTIEENLAIHAALLGLSRSEGAQKIDSLLQQFRLTDRRGDRVKELSGGLARRAELAKSLLKTPKVLFLDEPTTGLDPAARYEFWKELKKLSAQGVTLLVTTHLMDEAELCDELIFISEGKLAGEGSPEKLKEQMGADVMFLQAKNLAPISDWIKARDPQAKISQENDQNKLKVVSPQCRDWMPQLMTEFRQSLVHLEWGQATLADVYFSKTGKSL